MNKLKNIIITAGIIGGLNVHGFSQKIENNTKKIQGDIIEAINSTPSMKGNINSDIYDLEKNEVKAIFQDYFNSIRKKNGKEALKINDTLCNVASNYADSLSKRESFNRNSHRDKLGNGVGERLSSAGYKYILCGENLSLGATSVIAVINGWMESDLHRDINLLSDNYKEFGIGFINGEKGDLGSYYRVLVLATPYSGE